MPTETEVPTQTEAMETLILPPEPISLTFTASDGTDLMGLLYPAATEDAPMVVLMHWVRSDQSDWASIAAWLQNRGYEPDIPPAPPPWQDSSWFPTMPEELSFHVFTFTFRGCQGGCQTFDAEGWLLDVEGAMDHLGKLESVTFSQMATMGASIGADGAAYGCHYFNEAHGGCQGAFSLSPGGYLNRPYPEEVKNLEKENPPKSAWCLFSTGDQESAVMCNHAGGDYYRGVSYPGDDHGMTIFSPDRDPNPLNLFMEFMDMTGVCSGCF